MTTGIKCGHCHQVHATVDEVRLCADLAHAGLPTSKPVVALVGGQAPTEKQLNFVHKLLAEREHQFDASNLDQYNRAGMSQLISDLCTLPKKSGKPVHVELEDGIYRKDDVLYRVYHTVHGANQQVADLINLDAPKEAKKKDKFTYLGKKGVVGLLPEHQLSFAEGVAIASAYEWCCACGTILHNGKSVELGIGPICRKKFI